MQQADAHRNASLATAKRYIYRVTDTEQDLDSHGAVKKTNTEERENFWVNGIHISRLLSRDGKPISGDELKKQNVEIDKRIVAAKERQKAIAANPPPPSNKQSSTGLTLPRLFDLGTFSNPRRVVFHDRDTIAVDYTGNPSAKGRDVLESAVRYLNGTLWIDEQDHALVRVEAHFYDDFKLGGGMLADVHKGATFEQEWTKVNDEVWLPALFAGHGSARIALFFNHSGAVETRESDYRKFQASSTVLPGFSTPDTDGDQADRPVLEPAAPSSPNR